MEFYQLSVVICPIKGAISAVEDYRFGFYVASLMSQPLPGDINELRYYSVNHTCSYVDRRHPDLGPQSQLGLRAIRWNWSDRYYFAGACFDRKNLIIQQP